MDESRRGSNDIASAAANPVNVGIIAIATAVVIIAVIIV
jgi:hypothetical protein